MNELQIFKNPAFGNVRVVMIEDEPWFVAKDVAMALDYPESSIRNLPQLLRHVPGEWKGHNPIMTLGGMQDVITISEQGLYFFLGRSDKSKALPFQKWAAGDVFPFLRKNGYYGQITAEQIVANPDILIELGNSLKRSRQECLALTERCNTLEAKKKSIENAFWNDRPKVAFANSFTVSRKAIDVADMAKLIIQNTGVQVGKIKLYKFLRQIGWVCKNNRKRCNPTQFAIDQGYLVSRERVFEYPRFGMRWYLVSMVTPKGQLWLLDHFLDGRRLC